MADSLEAGIRAARKMARKIGPDPDHALRVCKTALEFFDLTQALHNLGARDRGLLEAGALLHDVGLAEDAATHHKRSRDLILASQIEGFSDKDLKMVACVARYHRKAAPDKRHKVYRTLDEDAQGTVTKLAALLRIADGLDRSHCGVTHVVKVQPKNRRLLVVVGQRKPSRVDVWGGLRKRHLFESVFALTVDIVTEHEIAAETGADTRA